MSHQQAVSVSIYSKPRCAQCDATKRALTKEGISYTEHDVTKEPAALAQIKEAGYSQAPVVIVRGPNGERSWSGFHPNKIREMKSLMAEGQGSREQQERRRDEALRSQKKQRTKHGMSR